MSISLNDHEVRIKKLEQTSIVDPSYSVFSSYKSDQILYEFNTPDMVIARDKKYIDITLNKPGYYLALYSTYNYIKEYGYIAHNGKIIARTQATVMTEYFNGSCYTIIDANKSDIVKFQHSSKIYNNEVSIVLVKLYAKILYYKILGTTSSFIKEVLLCLYRLKMLNLELPF